MPTSEPEWDIPLNLQPEPTDFSYDLDAALACVVSLRAEVPNDAFTAETLGTERTGSGVIIYLPGGPTGLVLTIGYLITEAETVWIRTSGGRAVPGHALAYDQSTGFGLVIALGQLGIAGLELGNSDAIAVDTTVVMAAGGGRARAMETKVVARHEFAGYWEYLLEEAIFTSPAHPYWSGAAVIGPDGKLIGIGSLTLQQGDMPGQRTDMNMVVPTALLEPILTSMLTTGSSGLPPRPWLGVYVMENDGALVVGGTTDGGPADRAGIRQGDHIIGVGGEEITDIATLWRHLWSAGAPGVQVKLQLGRDHNQITVRVTTSDRSKYLRSPLMH